MKTNDSEHLRVSPAAGVFTVFEGHSEDVDARVEVGGEFSERVYALALVLYDDGAHADTAVAAAVNSPAIAAAVDSAANRDA